MRHLHAWFTQTEMCSLHILPVEIIHRIFDHFDGQTILLSVRYVCKRLYTITDSYNRYELDFSYISKSDFHLIHRIIDPKNVISLTLSDGNKTPDQIGLFLLHFCIDQFIQLRSLTLIDVQDSVLSKFQKYSIKCPLTILSIEYQSSRCIEAIQWQKASHQL